MGAEDKTGTGMHAEAAGLDRAAALERIGGDAALLAEVAGLFLQEYPVLLAQIHSAHTSGNAQQMERAAHSLKGSVATFGAARAAHAAFAVERLGRAGELAAADDAITQLEAELARVRPELEELARSA
jgi:HPt (histidine-containing phosphotransfer) domain-containing protein